MERFFRIVLAVAIAILCLDIFIPRPLQAGRLALWSPYFGAVWHRPKWKVPAIPHPHIAIAWHHGQLIHLPAWQGYGKIRYTEVLATAYLVVDNQDYPGHHCPVYNAHTASGTTVKRGSIAIDRGLFRFGTRMIVPQYGYGVARDTGGFINGHHIDLAMYSCHEALTWGARTIKIAYAPPVKK